MKNFFKPVKQEKCQHVTIVWAPQLESVKLMIQEHYDTPEYDDTVIFVNIWYDDNLQAFHPYYFPQKRKIFYCLEHSRDMGNANDEPTTLMLNDLKFLGVDEVWTMEPNAGVFEGAFGNIKFMPVRYTSFIQKSNLNLHKFIDLGFVGIMSSTASPHRLNFYESYLNTDKDFSLKILNGESISSFKYELDTCKFVLDLRRVDSQELQNQVRLFEHICLGHTVLSEKCKENWFPGLIYEWNDINNLHTLIKTVTPQDKSEEYKVLTYSDEAYELYKLNIINGYYE